MVKLSIKFALVTLSSIILSSCASTGTECVARQPLNIKDPAPLSLEYFPMVIVTEKNQADTFKELKKTVKDPAIIGMSPKSYETLTINAEKLQSRLRLQYQIIQEYKNYYEQQKDK